MSTLEAIILGYFVNALWQVPLLFASAWLITRALRPVAPHIEYRVWYTAIVMQTVLPALSLLPLEKLRALFLSHEAGDHARVTVTVGDGFAQALRLSPMLRHGAAIAYLLVLVYFAVRFLWRTQRVVRLRARSIPITLSDEEAGLWQQCAARFDVSRAEIAVSSEIAGPVTLGISSHLILLPADLYAGLYAGLSIDEFHTVLAHEFAHIQRRDFARNLALQAVSLPIAFHPAFWITHRLLVESREMTCDLLAANLTGSTNYARSLLQLAARIVTGTPATFPHAIGIFDASSFERRLMQLTRKHTFVPAPRQAILAAAGIAFALGTCASALALRVHLNPAPAPLATAASPQQEKAVRISGGVMAGQVESRVAPTYPQAAKDARIQGSVVLSAIIGRDGSIEKLEVVSGPRELQTSALDAVRQWVYKPYLLNGEPVEVETTITVTYSFGTDN